MFVGSSSMVHKNPRPKDDLTEVEKVRNNVDQSF